MNDKSQSSPSEQAEKRGSNYLLAENKTKADFEATVSKLPAKQATIPKHSSRLVSFFGFIFLGMAIFDEIMHRRDVMNYTSLLFGLMAFTVFYCLQSIEKRLASIEQEQECNAIGEGDSHREVVKHTLRGLDDVKESPLSSRSILEIGNENQ